MRPPAGRRYGAQVPALHVQVKRLNSPHGPHFVAQVPQLLLSLCGFTHAPPQHDSPVAHALPHAPQLLVSVSNVTQPAPGQCVLPASVLTHLQA